MTSIVGMKLSTTFGPSSNAITKFNMLKEASGQGAKEISNQRAGTYSRLNGTFKNQHGPMFALVPLLLFIFMLFRLAELHFFFQGWIDPVYAYLMNGLTFALGSNDVGHVDHPGTPLQLFIALMITIIGWFHNSDDLATDVLTHPEYYLRIISVTLIMINCVVIGLLGNYAYKKLRSIQLAVAIQLLPLLSAQLVTFMPIVACETVVDFLAFAIAAVIIIYDNQKQENTKLILLMAVLSALMVATKISTLVILTVPFLVFAKARSKAVYLGATFFLILLFVSPVLGKLGIFANFLGKMATHTGQYGSGEAKMFDSTIYFQSLKMMLAKEFTFTLHVLLLPVGGVLIIKKGIHGTLKRIYIAIAVATIFQMLVVARHYSFHYLMPVFALCMPLHGYFWIRYFQPKISKVPARILSLVALSLVAGVFIRLTVKNNFQKGIVNSVEKTTQMVQSELKGKYIIITEYNNDAACPEPALRFGLSYTGGNMKARYVPILEAAYPDNYLWNSRNGFTDWKGSYLASDIFLQEKKMYIYANTGSCEFSREKINEMIQQTEMSDFVTLKFVYQNEDMGEVIAQANIDHDKLADYYQSSVSIETNMEAVTTQGDFIQSNNPEYTFKGAALLSGRFARSGKKSLLLTASNPYALDFSFPVSMGTHYKIECWQKSNGQKQALVVAAASKSELFYQTSIENANPSNDWGRAELNVTIPKNYAESTIHFYLWNPSQDSIWVDDFHLSVFK